MYKIFKIQVFDKDNNQLYGLYAKEEEYQQRLNEAMVFHNGLDTTLINEDITDIIEAERIEKENRLAEIEQIKKAINLIDASDKPVWEKRLLKRLVKELKN